MAYFLVVSNGQQDHWHTVVAEVLSSIGRLDSVQQEMGVKRVKEMSYDLVIIDATTVQNTDLLIRRILAQQPQTRVVVVTASPTWQLARASFLAGAIDYILKSPNKDEMMMAIKNALSKPPRPQQ